MRQDDTAQMLFARLTGRFEDLSALAVEGQSSGVDADKAIGLTDKIKDLLARASRDLADLERLLTS